MKPAFLLLSGWLLSGCVTPGSRTSDSRDYAITTCEVSPQEIELVQKRARNYISRHPNSAAEVRFLAVKAGSVFPSEVQDLWIKLGRSQTSSSAYAQWKGQSFKLFCVLIVDRLTQLPLTKRICFSKHPGTRGNRSNRRSSCALCWNRELRNFLSARWRWLADPSPRIQEPRPVLRIRSRLPSLVAAQFIAHIIPA